MSAQTSQDVPWDTASLAGSLKVFG